MFNKSNEANYPWVKIIWQLEAVDIATGGLKRKYQNHYKTKHAFDKQMWHLSSFKVAWLIE